MWPLGKLISKINDFQNYFRREWPYVFYVKNLWKSKIILKKLFWMWRSTQNNLFKVGLMFALLMSDVSICLQDFDGFCRIAVTLLPDKKIPSCCTKNAPCHLSMGWLVVLWQHPVRVDDQPVDRRCASLSQTACHCHVEISAPGGSVLRQICDHSPGEAYEVRSFWANPFFCPEGSRTLQWRSANCWSLHSSGRATWPRVSTHTFCQYFVIKLRIYAEIFVNLWYYPECNIWIPVRYCAVFISRYVPIFASDTVVSWRCFSSAVLRGSLRGVDTFQGIEVEHAMSDHMPWQWELAETASAPFQNPQKTSRSVKNV